MGEHVAIIEIVSVSNVITVMSVKIRYNYTARGTHAMPLSFIGFPMTIVWR